MTPKANTNANTQAQAPQIQTIGGLAVDDKFFKTYVPAAFQGADKSIDGIVQILTMGGMSGDKIAAMMADPDGPTQLNSVLSNPNFQATVARRMPVQQSGSQVSGSAAQPSAPGKPAAGAEKPKKPATYPAPQSPADQSAGVQSFGGVAGVSANIAGIRGGAIKTLREEISADGSRVTVADFYEPRPDGSTALVGREIKDADGNVISSEGQTESDDTKAQKATSTKPARRTMAEWAAPENRKSFGERMDANLDKFTQSGGSPNLANKLAIGTLSAGQHMGDEAAAMLYRNWPAAVGAATALGLGGRYLMGSGTSSPPQQPATMDDQSYMQLFGLPPQQAPQPAPKPAPNPAGTPPLNNSTLMQLQRLMQAREMA